MKTEGVVGGAGGRTVRWREASAPRSQQRRRNAGGGNWLKFARVPITATRQTTPRPQVLTASVRAVRKLPVALSSHAGSMMVSCRRSRWRGGRGWARSGGPPGLLGDGGQDERGDNGQTKASRNFSTTVVGFVQGCPEKKWDQFGRCRRGPEVGELTPPTHPSQAWQPPPSHPSQSPQASRRTRTGVRRGRQQALDTPQHTTLAASSGSTLVRKLSWAAARRSIDMQPSSLGKISLQLFLSDPRRVSAGPELAVVRFLRGMGHEGRMDHDEGIKCTARHPGLSDRSQ